MFKYYFKFTFKPCLALLIIGLSVFRASNRPNPLIRTILGEKNGLIHPPGRFYGRPRAIQTNWNRCHPDKNPTTGLRDRVPFSWVLGTPAAGANPMRWPP